MIVLRDLTKIYRLGGHVKVVANRINAVFPTGISVGLLGRNGAGKSTLLKMIAGTVHPTWGQVLSDGLVSFPVGLASSLHPDLTGAQNTRFVARIYGADTDELMHWVEDFAELGEHFHLPVRTYSSGMRGRLSFGINMGIDFDTYLVDEVTAVGDADFKRKSRDVFLRRMKKAGAVYVSHSMGMIRELCQAGAVLEAGKLHYFDDVQEAIDHYNHSLDPERMHASAALPGGAGVTDFPYDARMLYGLGLPQTASDWLGDCLRRHRACHFAKVREPHYFDVRAGQGAAMLHRRQKAVRDLVGRIGQGSDEEQRNTLRLVAEVGELLALHAAPLDGAGRHAAYVDFLTAKRRGQPVICDFTSSYALLPEKELAEMAALGTGRFAVVLRDPLARLWAQIQASMPARAPAVGGGPEAQAEEDFRMDRITAIVQRAAAGGPATLGRTWPEADYAGMFDRLDRVVAEDRIVTLFHEDIPGRAAIDTLTGVLDIPPLPESSLPPAPATDRPPACPPEIRDMLMRLLAPQYEAMRDRFGARLPAQWEDF